MQKRVEELDSQRAAEPQCSARCHFATLKWIHVRDHFGLCSKLPGSTGRQERSIIGRYEMQVKAAEEETRHANSRAAEATAELARVQQKLLAAEEAAGRTARRVELLERDVQAEKSHARATGERLERAQARLSSLESQVRLTLRISIARVQIVLGSARYHRRELLSIF